MAVDEGTRRRRWRPSMTELIVLGLVAGIVAGLFFGEAMGGLSIVGDVFIALTQVTVFPYIVVGLMRGVGSLDTVTAKRLATRAVPVLLAVWALSIAVLYAMTAAFPERVSDSFYDPNRVAAAGEAGAIDWVSYVPANPFASLAQGIVPAIVVLAMFLGVALIGMPRKERLLDGLGFVDEVLGRISGTVILYGSPIGIFAIVSSTVGTSDLNQMKDLSVYMVTYVMAVLVFTLVVLPLAVSAFTGITYRRLVQAYKAPALLALATDAFITLPLIAKSTRELLEEKGAEKNQAAQLADTLVPLGYVVPLFGSITTLLFVRFVAWYEGAALSVGQIASLTGSGIITLFGGEPTVSIPFLLNTMGLPKEALSLYLAADSVLGFPHDFAGAVAISGLAAAAGVAVLGLSRGWSTKALVAVVTSVVVVLAGTLVTGFVLRPLATTESEGYQTLQRMRVRIQVPATVYRTIDEAPAARSLGAPGSLLDDIRTSGVLRVGYLPNAFPFSYFNADDELVGYDIERMYYFASALQSQRIDFIPVPREDFAPMLDSGMVDIVAGAPYLTPALYQQVDFTSIYLTLHIAIVAPDSEAENYRTEEALAALDGARIAVQKGSYYADAIRQGNENLVVVEVDDPMDFFESDVADALFTSAEEGSAMTIMHPRYEVVVPQFPQPPLYLAYPVPKGQVDWILFLDNWLTTLDKSPEGQGQYDYWITGRTAVETTPRWSIARDVLGWDL